MAPRAKACGRNINGTAQRAEPGLSGSSQNHTRNVKSEGNLSVLPGHPLKEQQWEGGQSQASPQTGSAFTSSLGNQKKALVPSELPVQPQTVPPSHLHPRFRPLPKRPFSPAPQPHTHGDLEMKTRWRWSRAGGSSAAHPPPYHTPT